MSKSHASCSGLLSNPTSLCRLVHRTADTTYSEVGCTPDGQPHELVQSSSENDTDSKQKLVTWHNFLYEMDVRIIGHVQN